MQTVGPGRPAHNAHPQSCSGEPIPPDEVVKRERDKKEKKLRKQLERQLKRLQQSKTKPGVNTATLTEAIHQTLCEIKAVNYTAKEPDELVGNELHSLLVDALSIDCCNEMLKKVFHPTSQRPPRSSSPLNFTKFNAAAAAAAAAAVAAAANINGPNALKNKNSSQTNFDHHHISDRPLSDTKTNPFSIDNLLSSRHVSNSLFSAAAAAAAAAAAVSITQPVGFLVNHSSGNHKLGKEGKDYEEYEEIIDEEHSDNDDDAISNCTYRSNNSDGNLIMSPKRSNEELETVNGTKKSRVLKSLQVDIEECNPTDLSIIKSTQSKQCKTPVPETMEHSQQVSPGGHPPNQSSQSVIDVPLKLSRKFTESFTNSDASIINS